MSWNASPVWSVWRRIPFSMDGPKQRRDGREQQPLLCILYTLARYIWGYIIEYDNSIYIYHGIHMIIIYIYVYRERELVVATIRYTASIDGSSKHGTWSHQAVMPSQPSPSTKPSDSKSTLQNRSAKIGLICHYRYSKIVWVSLTHLLDPIIPPPW